MSPAAAVGLPRVSLSGPLATNLPYEPWFFGEMGAEETVEMLAGQAPGSFLVRFSSLKQVLTASCVDKNKTVHHLRFKRTDSGYTTIVLPPYTSNESVSATSIEDLLLKRHSSHFVHALANPTTVRNGVLHRLACGDVVDDALLLTMSNEAEERDRDHDAHLRSMTISGGSGPNLALSDGEREAAEADLQLLIETLIYSDTAVSVPKGGKAGSIGQNGAGTVSQSSTSGSFLNLLSGGGGQSLNRRAGMNLTPILNPAAAAASASAHQKPVVIETHGTVKVLNPIFDGQSSKPYAPSALTMTKSYRKVLMDAAALQAGAPLGSSRTAKSPDQQSGETGTTTTLSFLKPSHGSPPGTPVSPVSPPHSPSSSFTQSPKRQFLSKLPLSNGTRWLLLFSDILCLCSRSFIVKRFNLATTWVRDFSLLPVALGSGSGSGSGAGTISAAASEKIAARVGSNPSIATGAASPRVAFHGTAFRIVGPEDRIIVKAKSHLEKYQFTRLIQSTIMDYLERNGWVLGEERRFARYTFINGSVYSGGWENVAFHGIGTFIDQARAVKYEGMWRMGKREGMGTQWDLARPSMYTGAWVNDRRHGFGTHEQCEGKDVRNYIGDWADGKRHGVGTLTFRGGERFQCAWTHDLPASSEPICSIRYVNGDTYAGEWVYFQAGKVVSLEDKGFSVEDMDLSRIQRHGFGIMRVAAGERYEGMWTHNARHGAGVLTVEGLQRLRYKGGWVQGKMYGRGVLELGDAGQLQAMFGGGDWKTGLSMANGVFTRVRSAEGEKEEGVARMEVEYFAHMEKWEPFIASRTARAPKADNVQSLADAETRINHFLGSREYGLTRACGDFSRLIQHLEIEPLRRFASTLMEVYSFVGSLTKTCVRMVEVQVNPERVSSLILYHLCPSMYAHVIVAFGRYHADADLQIQLNVKRLRRLPLDIQFKLMGLNENWLPAQPQVGEGKRIAIRGPAPPTRPNPRTIGTVRRQGMVIQDAITPSVFYNALNFKKSFATITSLSHKPSTPSPPAPAPTPQSPTLSSATAKPTAGAPPVAQYNTPSHVAVAAAAARRRTVTPSTPLSESPIVSALQQFASSPSPLEPPGQGAPLASPTYHAHAGSASNMIVPLASSFAIGGGLLNSKTNLKKQTSAEKKGPNLFTNPYAFLGDLDDFCTATRPSDKLACLVRLTEKMTTYIASVQSDFGADEFLPCMIFALSRANIPDMFAQCQYMEEFLNEDAMAGMEGYVMTNFQIALEFLLSLGPQLEAHAAAS
eukprot:TRINITY_DN3813_c0_g1_i1.p1 TRINITY_DN3813_c0_g1~~TRINITY_DN3813_c0_g1_i1.p1  ORF type:complete len:1464 (-),score=400.70 TRINITY_DN3813_c0_g1_i1:144-3929(-)